MNFIIGFVKIANRPYSILFSQDISCDNTQEGIFCKVGPGMALGFFNLGPGTRMFGQIGVPSIFWGSQNLGDPLREKESNQLGINIDAYA